MRPVPVLGCSRQVRLDDAATASSDSGKGAVKRHPGDAPMPVRHRRDKARDAPAHIGGKRRDTPVQARANRERELLDRSELAPSDRLPVVVDETPWARPVSTSSRVCH